MGCFINFFLLYIKMSESALTYYQKKPRRDTK